MAQLQLGCEEIIATAKMSAFPLRYSNTFQKKDMNRDSHIASSPISQSFFFEEVRCLILASSQRKLREYIELLKFDVTIKSKRM